MGWLKRMLSNDMNEYMLEMRFTGRILRLEEKIRTLEFQLSCGLRGHSFQLRRAEARDGVTLGEFTCSSCKASLQRELTPNEVRYANALGYRLPVPPAEED